jgi:FkbM family methyltransferase
MQLEKNSIATIIIPVHDEILYLHQTLDSILDQTYKNFDVLFVIDRLQDSSLIWLKKIISNHKNFYWIESKKPGIAEALNLGILESKTKYIIRIDADDLMEKNRVEKQIQFMENNSDVTILGSQIELFNENGPLHVSNYPHKHEQIAEQMFYLNAIAHPSVIIRRKNLLKLASYDPYFDGIEDYALWLTLLDKGAVFENSQEVLTRYRIHGQQSTQKNHSRNQDLKTILKLESILGVGQSGSRQEPKEYIKLLRIRLKEQDKYLSKKFQTHEFLEQLFEGGLESVRKHPLNKIKLLLKLLSVDSVFTLKLIYKFGWKHFRVKKRKLDNIFSKSRAKQWLKNYLYFFIIGFISCKYLYRIPRQLINEIGKYLEQHSNSIRLIEHKKLPGLAFYDGEDWLHIWKTGALIWNDFKWNAHEIVNADIELFTENYQPQQGDLVFDVGAGVGTSTLNFSRMVGRRGRVIAFEPDTDSHRRLTKLKDLFGLRNTFIFNLGLFDHTTTLTLYKDNEIGSRNSIYSQNLPGKQQIEVTTLEKFIVTHNIQHINYIKMNIEGAEYSALKGLGKYFANVNHFVVACHDFIEIDELRTLKNVIDIFKQKNFTPKQHDISRTEPWKSFYVYASRNN